LPPGRYQLQTAVIDREADQASVKQSVLIVPASSGTGLGVSDIVWVRSVKASQTPDPGNPLYSPQGEITPELEPMLARTDPAIFYFVAYPPDNAHDKPEARIAVTRDGRVITSNGLTTPDPDKNGAYPYRVTLPLIQLEPGQYELIVTVKQNGVQTARETLFEVH